MYLVATPLKFVNSLLHFSLEGQRTSKPILFLQHPDHVFQTFVRFSVVCNIFAGLTYYEYLPRLGVIMYTFPPICQILLSAHVQTIGPTTSSSGSQGIGQDIGVFKERIEPNAFAMPLVPQIFIGKGWLFNIRWPALLFACTIR